MAKCKYLVTIFLLLLTNMIFAATLSGTVKNSEGEPLAYASVYVEHTTYGVSTDELGRYFMELDTGIHVVVISYVGYKSEKFEVTLNANDQIIKNVALNFNYELLGTIEIVSNTVDKAKAIMKKVRDKRPFYNKQLRSYQCEVYLKSSLEKQEKHVYDSIKVESNSASFEEYMKKEKMNLIESFSEYYVERPFKKKEIILAQHDYSEEKNNPTFTVSVEENYGRKEIGSTTFLNSNPYLIYENILSGDYNFYENNLDLKKISQKPLLSPIASTSALSYKYDYEGGFEENGHLIHKIKVIPRFKTDALFNGFIFIEDQTWALISVDLNVNKSALTFCKRFKIIQNYRVFDNDIYVPSRRELNYTIYDMTHYIMGNTRLKFDAYQINIDFPSKTFSNEIIQYKVDALDKEESYWENIRPLTLDQKELSFVHSADSIKIYYNSDVYKLKRDSIYNNVNIWSVLLNGVGYRNSFTGNLFYIDPIIAQILPLGIGGYRHRIGGHYIKRFESGDDLEIYPDIDYGFNNKDLKGSLKVAWTYLPLKHAKTSLKVGNTYELINNYESFSSLLSRNNYVNSKSIEIAQRLEIINGLYGELTFHFGDQIPIIDLDLAEWAKKLFGENNTPKDFKRYKKTEVRLDLQYRMKQKYLIRRNRKVILENNYPVFYMTYRKGINGLFESEVDYDYLELGVVGDTEFGRFGQAKWELLSGSFLNKTNLRTLEYKFFRGSDPWIFSDPLQSFQLLGPTFSTPDGYVRASMIHHFEGYILNKIPLVNKLKLGIAAGIGLLLIQDQNYSHGEAFVGLERNIRLRKELLRIGIYGVTADDNFSRPKFTYKIGISFYNSFLGKWNY